MFYVVAGRTHFNEPMTAAEALAFVVEAAGQDVEVRDDFWRVIPIEQLEEAAHL